MNHPSSSNELYTIRMVDPGIWQIQIRLPRTPLRNVNAYLLQGRGRNILIDTGYRSEACVSALRAAFGQIGSRFEDTDILLTHFHDDHAGAATDLVSPGRKIWYPAAEDRYFAITSRQTGFYKQSRKARYMAEGLSESSFNEMMDYRNMGAAGPDFGSPALTKLSPDQSLSAGDFVLQPVPTPGHTPGHLCYWEPKRRILFTGDHLLFDISSNIIFWDGIEDILGTYLDSLKKLLQYPVRLALPGHRESADMKERVHQLLSHHEARLAECERIIGNAPGCTSIDITRELSWHVRRKGSHELPLPVLRYAFGECISHLDHLRVLGRIRRVPGSGGARYYLP